ncbi:MAG TPA: alpha/beta fold hydrolase [Candidatus Cybelea sp.]|nr:alpha/beta fold hydrolase [Candidatus Cybelea sp.]
MDVLSELRYPRTRLAKVFSGFLALLLFAIISISTISGFLLYQTLRPARNPASFDLSVMMGHPATFAFTVAGGAQREGWLFPGLRGAPTVVVCHGYLSQRADVLTLVTALQDHQFNVFLFDFAGHGTSLGLTTLGYRETDELRAAVQALSTRDDVDPQNFGLWGVDMGGYAALEVAETDPRIKALAVDDAYDDPRVMLKIQVKKSGLNSLPGVLRFTDFGFRMMNYSYRNEPAVSARLASVQGIPKLFVQADDRAALSEETLRLFAKAPEPKQALRDRLSYRDMNDDDRKSYESQIVNFFLQNIPPSTSR